MADQPQGQTTPPVLKNRKVNEEILKQARVQEFLLAEKRRAVLRKRNFFTLGLLVAGVAGIYGYAIYTVKQEKFDDFDD